MVCFLILFEGRFPLRKISVGSDWTFFHLYYPHHQTKKVENTLSPGFGSQVQTGTEKLYRKPMRGFNFVPIQSDPMLIFLSENWPYKASLFPLRKISIGSDRNKLFWSGGVDNAYFPAWKPAFIVHVSFWCSCQDPQGQSPLFGYVILAHTPSYLLTPC